MRRQFEHEEHNRRDKALKPDYVEAIRLQGDNFDRGGETPTKLMSFRGNTVYLNLTPFLLDDKLKMIRILERHTEFSFRGVSGTVLRLRRHPELAQDVIDRFEMTRRSILRADTFTAEWNPRRQCNTYVAEYTLFLRPKQEPFPIRFLDHFGFMALISVKE